MPPPEGISERRRFLCCLRGEIAAEGGCCCSLVEEVISGPLGIIETEFAVVAFMRKGDVLTARRLCRFCCCCCSFEVSSSDFFGKLVFIICGGPGGIVDVGGGIG